jgi:flagellar biosynthesis GTPase FlhF
LTVEEKMLAELQAQTASLESQLTAMETSREAAQESASKQIAELQKAKDAARESADLQIAEMIKQVNAALQAKAESSDFYETFLAKVQEDRERADAYYTEALLKLAGIIEETFRTAENTDNILNRSGWEEVLKPIGTLGAKQDETNTELRASVNVLQAGFKELSAEVRSVTQAVGENTTATRLGLEAIAIKR